MLGGVYSSTKALLRSYVWLCFCCSCRLSGLVYVLKFLGFALRCVAACAGNLPEARQFARGKVNRKRAERGKSAAAGKEMILLGGQLRRFLSLG